MTSAFGLCQTLAWLPTRHATLKCLPGIARHFGVREAGIHLLGCRRPSAAYTTDDIYADWKGQDLLRDRAADAMKVYGDSAGYKLRAAMLGGSSKLSRPPPGGSRTHTHPLSCKG